MHRVNEINLMPYHPLGASKGERLGKAGRFPATGFPDEAEVGRWLEVVAAHTRVPVKQA